ncbi:uncharacterized protein LOC117784419 [Drosophila innubila]|uniref:uncharacterized protein LOC117784419 n=1 Tax=Drosophila innubila TaxID=198719 RepID=UPI00148DB611|nr:uncharacterized protein LOC117784419 [Drosophila innubila]
MLQLKTTLLCCGLLAVLVGHCQVAAKKNETLVDPDCPPDDDRDGNDELCKDFQILRDLIDFEVLAELIQSHYQCDAKFRKAVCYYKTSRFNLVIEQLQRSEAYHELLEVLRNAGINTTDIDNIADIFECIEVPIMPIDKKYNCKELRGHTFIGDVLAAMPHQAIREYSYSSRVNNTNFALFRQTVTSAEFQAALRSNLLKRDAVRALNVLRRNGWDLPELLRGAMSILSW